MPSTFTTILSLLFASGPSAISGGVPGVVVDSFDGHAIGARPHVVVECLEIFEPFVADHDAASPVVFVQFVVGVVTTGFHPLPNAVGQSTGQSVGVVSPGLRLQAPATSGVVGLKIGSPNEMGISTNTPTLPPSLFLFCMGGPLRAGDDGEAIKGFSDEIVGHGVNPTTSLSGGQV